MSSASRPSWWPDTSTKLGLRVAHSLRAFSFTLSAAEGSFHSVAFTDFGEFDIFGFVAGVFAGFAELF